MQKFKNSILNGAIILGVGAFISKFLGAIYRPLLTKIIGSVGLGLYQMVFPVYATLLDFSGAGLPNALSKLISGFSEKEKKQKSTKFLAVAIRLFSVLGVIFSFFLAIFCKLISRLQGNKNAYLAYLTISPSVLLVSLLCCFRGYFQGNMNMKPTAISQLIEQGVKIIVGLIIAYLLAYNVVYATAGVTLAVTISEFIALLFLYLLYKKKGGLNLRINFDKSEFKEISLKLIKIALPTTIIAVILPFSQIIDSFLTLNILSKYLDNATGLYGLFSGAVSSVIGLPVAICYGLAVVGVPVISGAKVGENRQKKAKTLLVLTFISAVLFCIALYLFAPLVVDILFRSLSNDEKILVVRLIKLCSVNVVFLSMIQTLNSLFIGIGKTIMPIVSLLLGVTVKTFLNLLLLPNPNFNIYGAGVALIACYFFTCLVNLIILMFIRDKNENPRLIVRRSST